MTAYQDEADTYLSAFIDWWEQQALVDLIFMSTRHVVANRRRDLVRQKR
jgi:hypothetical protein